MNKYSGIDLHSNNCVVVVSDEDDRVCCERRVPNDLAKIVALLEPYRNDLVGVAVESTFNTYLVDLSISPALAAGIYEGTFTVKVCRDSNCTRNFPGSPMALPYKITVLPAPPPPVLPLTAAGIVPLGISMHLGGNAPGRSTVVVKAGARSWNASTNTSWITLVRGSGTGDGLFDVSYDVSGLPIGLHRATIVVMGSDGASVDVPVALTILPNGFTMSHNAWPAQQESNL